MINCIFRCFSKDLLVVCHVSVGIRRQCGATHKHIHMTAMCNLRAGFWLDDL